MLYRLKRRVFKRPRNTTRVCLRTANELLHILGLTIDNLENLSCRSRDLFLNESVQFLSGLLDVLDPEKIPYKFDCVVLSKATRQQEKDARDRRLLSFRVTQASMEINITIKLINMSSIAGVGEIAVYILRRLTKRSIDSSKSTSTSQLVMIPLAAWFVWMSIGYPHMNQGTIHTSSRTPRPACIAFVGGNNVCEND
jgi:hypothetical protein